MVLVFLIHKCLENKNIIKNSWFRNFHKKLDAIKQLQLIFWSLCYKL